MFSASRIRPFAATVAAAGLLMSACGDDATTTESATAADSSTSDHAHELYEVPDGVAVPTLAIEVEPDPKAGANLFIEVADFTISPEHASTEPVAGEGHFHAYVDGKKVARFYNRALHLDIGEGVGHVAYTVSDLEAEVAKLEEAGFPVILSITPAGRAERTAVYVDTRPKFSGLIIELMQRPPS